MAQRVQTLFVSDLSGDDLGESGQTVRFGYKGVEYEIDLSENEIADFDKAIGMYIEHGRKVGGRRQAGQKSSASKEDLSKIRQWAKANGHQVSERGRIAQAVKDAYYAAN
ncbi:histone-like nucleoid-structuring protein Lsr2 [Ornithinimicrobium sediminis]|uniref:histone-like nucleoid-structuring protein Lsr2 n=1 Tax=Ornithinimicrobium sediminis TaxID=2904603 RepID=UPI001E4C9A42|nr:Lsr2 family protein [Ornithinimicrobium sediminis]MCE0488274.1 Lsr2 family protein [Ornithinimicrobium sediminis]